MKWSAFCLGLVLLLGCIVSVQAAVSKEKRIKEEITWEELATQNLAPEGPMFAAQPRALFGFVVPLERTADNALLEFLLVPYFGACIHVPPPPPNQIVRVTLAEPVPEIAAMDTVWVRGIFRVDVHEGAASYVVEGATLLRPNADDQWQRHLRAILLTLCCGGSIALGWLFGRRQLPAGIICLGMSCAAGMLVALGSAALVLRASLPTLGAFALGLLGVSLLVWRSIRSQTRMHDNTKGLGAKALALGVALHNYPECFLVCSLSFADSVVGTVLACAMLSHNLPLGISLGLGYTSLAARTNRVCACIAGVFPPLLAIATYYGVRNLVSAEGMRLGMACAGGILFGLALFELLPHALRHGSRARVVSGFVLGVSLVALALWVLAGHV